MNKEALKKSLGHHVRLRPQAKRFDGTVQLPDIDWDWVINRIETDHVELLNESTGHIAKLGMDHIHSFMSEPGRNIGQVKYGFLQLRVQISLVGRRLDIEPLPPGDWGKKPEAGIQSGGQNIGPQQVNSPSGGRPQIGKALEKVMQANAEARSRAQRLELLDTQGMASLSREYAELRKTLDEKIRDLQEHLTAIKLEQGSDGHAYLIRTDRVSLNFYLHTASPITNSRIVVREFDGALILPKDSGHQMFVPGEEPRQVSKREFCFDYVEAVGWCWKEKRQDSNPLPTAELADHLIVLILDLHGRFQGRERVFIDRTDTGVATEWS